MNELQVFNNEEFGEVRTVMQNGETWFIAKDICDTLGLSDTNRALLALDDDDKCKHEQYSGSGRKHMLINESGMYSLVLKIRKPQAKAFKKWITSEVLPIIRKTGGYVNNDEMFVNTYLAHADEMTKTLFKSTLETVRKQNEKIAVPEPKAEYHDNVLDSKNSFTITEIANDLGMTARKLNSLLHQLGVQRKVGATWVLYAEHRNKGYIDISTR
ncbi:phage antirepressor [Bacillus tropicus]|uniref:phage antirepressor n=1 Tax=Bacillus tropicus TaxID=2026188 RepID=UPI00207AE8A3|nr:phage antirepressor KilAC domain-containing protein [Bacillus tropicus]USK99526.1 phage antirepressor KilAC domain-containing protein [Bacillus tropicus]